MVLLTKAIRRYNATPNNPMRKLVLYLDDSILGQGFMGVAMVANTATLHFHGEKPNDSLQGNSEHMQMILGHIHTRTPSVYNTKQL